MNITLILTLGAQRGAISRKSLAPSIFAENFQNWGCSKSKQMNSGRTSLTKVNLSLDLASTLFPCEMTL